MLASRRLTLGGVQRATAGSVNGEGSDHSARDSHVPSGYGGRLFSLGHSTPGVLPRLVHEHDLGAVERHYEAFGEVLCRRDVHCAGIGSVERPEVIVEIGTLEVESL